MKFVVSALALGVVSGQGLWVPSAAPLSLPTTSTADAALGDVQLQLAWDAAVSQAISDGTWNRFFGSEPLFSLPSSCVGVNPSTGVVVYPNYPRGALAASLQRGTVRACITGSTLPFKVCYTPAHIHVVHARADNIQYSPSGQVMLDTTGGAPVGTYVDWANAIVTNMGRAYRRRFMTLTWAVLPTSDACLDSLLSGAVDVLPVSWASYPYNGFSRYHQAKASTCTTRASQLTAWVNASSPVTDGIANMTQLIAALRGSTPPKLGSVGNPGQRAGVLLGVTPTIYADIDTALSAVMNGTVDFYSGVATGVPPAYMPLLRRINDTSASPTETVTTLFRRPLINGEIPFGLLVSNTTNFPVQSDGSDPVALGDSQLYAAYMAAWNRVYASGGWASIFEADPLLVPHDACQGPASMFPFPTAPSGALSTILQQRTIRLPYLTNLVTVSPTGNIVLLDGTTNPPTGAYYAFDVAIVNAIAAAYATTITVQWVGYATSDAAIDDVLAGNLPWTSSSFVIGGRYRGIARSFRTSPSICFSTTGPVPVWVTTSAPYQSVSDLVTAVRAGNLNVVTAGPGSQGQASNFFQTTSVTAVLDANTAFTQLVNGGGTAPPVAVWDYAPPANLASSVRLLGYPVARLTAPLFRPAVLPAFPPATSTPTPVAEISGYSIIAALAVVTALLSAAMVIITAMYCANRSRTAHRKKLQGNVGEVVTPNALMRSP